MSKDAWGYQPRNNRPAPDWEVESQTDAVRAGLTRSGFGETSEALFLNSGFSYSSAQEAFDSFTDETDHFLYSRFHNPTVAMFEKRLAAMEGAEYCHAFGSGMAAVFASMAALLAAADLPDAEPVPVVNYEAGNNLLIVGPGAAALGWAERLADSLSISVLITDDAQGAELRHGHGDDVIELHLDLLAEIEVLAGEIERDEDDQPGLGRLHGVDQRDGVARGGDERREIGDGERGRVDLRAAQQLCAQRPRGGGNESQRHARRAARQAGELMP